MTESIPQLPNIPQLLFTQNHKKLWNPPRSPLNDGDHLTKPAPGVAIQVYQVLLRDGGKSHLGLGSFFPFLPRFLKKGMSKRPMEMMSRQALIGRLKKMVKSFPAPIREVKK